MKFNRKKRIIAGFVALFLLINIIMMVIPLLSKAAENISLTLVMDSRQISYSAPAVTVTYNGEKIISDTPPIIMSGRTLVPARAVFEKIGAKVNWDSAGRKVEITNNSIKITLFINNKTALVGSKSVEMDTEAKIINDRTYVPLRFIAENSGLNVGWNPSEYIASLTCKSNRISSVSYDGSGERLVVSVKGTGTLSYDYSVLPNPERLVIDFSDSIKDFQDFTFAGSSLISGIRYSQYQINPNVVRLVFDLNENTGYTMENNGKELKILFSPGSGTPSQTPQLHPSVTDGQYIVVLDPGHGGSDPGAVGKDENGNEILHEKDPNLKIALLVRDKLAANNVTVYMTRTTDVYVSLKERYEFANGKNADLFCSIHNNSVDNPETNGTMTMYAYKEPKEGYRLSGYEYAKIMQKHMVSVLNEKDFGPVQNSSLAVVRGTNMPAVITESLFVSNAGDRAKLMNDEVIAKLAGAIADGILEALTKI